MSALHAALLALVAGPRVVRPGDAPRAEYARLCASLDALLPPLAGTEVQLAAGAECRPRVLHGIAAQHGAELAAAVGATLLDASPWIDSSPRGGSAGAWVEAWLRAAPEAAAQALGAWVARPVRDELLEDPEACDVAQLPRVVGDSLADLACGRPQRPEHVAAVTRSTAAQLADLLSREPGVTLDDAARDALRAIAGAT